MIAIDTNVILHLLVKSQKEHERAREWLRTVQEPLVTTNINVGESLRLLSHPRVFPSPLSLADAIDLVGSLLDFYQMAVLEESERWWQGMKELLTTIPDLRGNEVFDARIALCLRHHGVRQICTLDSDFLKYPFLKRLSF